MRANREGARKRSCISGKWPGLFSDTDCSFFTIFTINQIILLTRLALAFFALKPWGPGPGARRGIVRKVTCRTARLSHEEVLFGTIHLPQFGESIYLV